MTALTLTAACPQTSAVRPTASRFPKGSLQRRAMLSPAYAKSANAAITPKTPITTRRPIGLRSALVMSRKIR